MEAARRDHRQLIPLEVKEPARGFLLDGKGPGNPHSGGCPGSYPPDNKLIRTITRHLPNYSILTKITLTKMKHFTKFFHSRPQDFRGHDYKVDSKSMTIPDVVPTLRDIILSGTATQVGTPIYDESFEAGVRRFGIQSAPLELVLNGREPLEAEEEERSDADNAQSGSPDVKHPAASDSEQPSGDPSGQN